MSDDIDIRSGGAIAVDTDRLRAGADGYRHVAARLDHLQGIAWRNAARLSARVALDDTAPRAWALARRLQKAMDDAATVARQLTHLANIYELVELGVAARNARDLGETAVLATRVSGIVLTDPEAAIEAQLVEFNWENGDFLAVGGQYVPLVAAFLGPVAAADLAKGLITAHPVTQQAGRIPRGAVLEGPAQPVELTRLAGRGSHHIGAPESLADATARIPREGAQVRVEKYSMPDGSRRFAVYIAGTNFAGGEKEAWDMKSNLDLYGGHRSASFDATEAALREAGAKPGDAIYEFGHSQGGMIAGRIATESGYDTRLLATFGSPTEAQVDAGTLSVQLRHSDDPVAALAGGGSAGRVGSPDSVVVQRFTDPMPGPQDLRDASTGGFGLPAHQLTEYTETATMFDRSDDARAGALQERLGELRGAASVEAFDFSVERK